MERAAERGDDFATSRLLGLLHQLGRDEERVVWLERAIETGTPSRDIRHLWACHFASANQLDNAEAVWSALVDEGDYIAVWELIGLLTTSGRDSDVHGVWERGFASGANPEMAWEAGSDLRFDVSYPVLEWLEELGEAGNARALRVLASYVYPMFEDDEWLDDLPGAERLGRRARLVRCSNEQWQLATKKLQKTLRSLRCRPTKLLMRCEVATRRRCGMRLQRAKSLANGMSQQCGGANLSLSALTGQSSLLPERWLSRVRQCSTIRSSPRRPRLVLSRLG